MKTAFFRFVGYGGGDFMLRLPALIFCLFCLYQKGNSQDQQRDSLIRVISEHRADTNGVIALNLLFRAEWKLHPEEAIKYLDQAMILAEQLDFQSGYAMTLRSYGEYYNAQGEHEKASAALLEGKTIYEKLNDQRGEISCLNGLGNLAVRQGNYSLALEYYLSTAQLNEELDNKTGMAISYQNVGGIHFRLGNVEKALEYIGKSLQLKESLQDSAGMVPTLNAMSAVYSAEKEFDKALQILFKALSIATNHSDQYEISSIINNIGVQYHYLGKIDSAKFFYHQALNNYKILDEKQELAILYINLGEIESSLENGKGAIAYYDSSQSIARDIGSMHFLSEAYRGLANANKILKDYQQALYWTDRFHLLKDSLAGEHVKMQINELQARYESSQKDKEIAELREQEAQALSTAERRKSFLIVAITLIATTIVVMLLYLGKRKAKEKQRRAELEQKALRAQMNPHFIFNSLGAIQQMYMSGEMDLANNYLGDFGKLMRKILENSGRETINLREELEMLKLYLNLEKERNSGFIEYDITIDQRIDQLGTQIPPMIIQPFVENAIWHGILPRKKKGKICIRLGISDESGKLICEVEDNGVGLTGHSGKTGHHPHAIRITEQRLGSKVKFTDLSPGTRVSIQIPT